VYRISEMYELLNKVYFNPIAFISVSMPKMCLLGDYRKYPRHRRKRGPGKLINKQFTTKLVAYCPSSSVKLKESRKRPGVAQRVPGGLGSQVS
jgi:hypothetical protein